MVAKEKGHCRLEQTHISSSFGTMPSSLHRNLALSPPQRHVHQASQLELLPSPDIKTQKSDGGSGAWEGSPLGVLLML